VKPARLSVEEALSERRASTIARASLDAVSAEELKAAVASKRAGPLPAWLLILVWISLSTGVSLSSRFVYIAYALEQVIFQNAGILKGGFPYPITLTAM
jgi:hypothetical protein